MKKTCVAALLMSLTFIYLGCHSGGNSSPGNASSAANTNLAESKAASGAAAAPGEAPVEDREAGVQYVIPAGWRYELVPGFSMLSTTDRSLRVAMLVSPAGNEAEIENALRTEISRVVQEFKREGDLQKREINGIPAVTARGTGVYEGKPVRLIANRLEAKKTVYTIALAVPGEFEKHQAEIDRFVGSVKKL